MSTDPSQDTSTTVSPLMHRFLNGIAGPESGGRYDVRYGGSAGPQYFTDYTNHPNVVTPIPGSNTTSTAAGRYQFLNSTWAPVAAKLGLKDFSPDNQDKGAAYLATSEYKRVTGRDLETDLQDPGKYHDIQAALQGTWATLSDKNIAAAMGKPLPPDQGGGTQQAGGQSGGQGGQGGGQSAVSQTAAGQGDNYARALANNSPYGGLQALAMLNGLIKPSQTQQQVAGSSITPWAVPFKPSNPLDTVAAFAQLAAHAKANPLCSMGGGGGGGSGDSDSYPPVGGGGMPGGGAGRGAPVAPGVPGGDGGGGYVMPPPADMPPGGVVPAGAPMGVVGGNFSMGTPGYVPAATVPPFTGEKYLGPVPNQLMPERYQRGPMGVPLVPVPPASAQPVFPSPLIDYPTLRVPRT